MLALLRRLAVRRARCSASRSTSCRRRSAALRTLADPNYQWTANFLATLYAVLGAFVLSAVLGVLLAIVIVWNDLLLRTVMPVLVLFNTLPKIALAPLFVIWLGYGIWPNIVIGTTIAFFPMVVNTAVGLASAEPEMLDLVRTLRASRWQVLTKIRFPNAVPYIFVGLKLNATMSVIGALVGEFVASERGLGSLIITGGVTMETRVDLRVADPDLGAGPGALRPGRGRRADRRAVGAPG